MKKTPKKTNPKLAFARNLHLPMMGPLEKSKNLGFRWLLESSLDHSDKPRILTTHEEAGRRKSTPMTQRQMQPWPTCPIQRPLKHLEHGSFQAKKIPAILLLQRLVLSKAQKQNRKAASQPASEVVFSLFFRCWGGTYFARGVTDLLSYKYQTLWPTTIREPPRFLADFWTVYTPSLHPWNCLNLLGCKKWFCKSWSTIVLLFRKVKQTV